MEHISDIGWFVIACIAVLIFAVIMLRGISFDWDDKEGSIGKEKAGNGIDSREGGL